MFVILSLTVDDEYFTGVVTFSILALFFAGVTTSVKLPYTYEFNEPIRYELTEVEAKDYYTKVNEDQNSVKLYRDNDIIKSDICDIDINDSSTNYVEYYKLSKLKEFRYYFLHWPGNTNYFYFHFTEDIKS